MILITGGARSGKSSYALSLGETFAKKAYFATAQALDLEMERRIAKHKQERDSSFRTFEVPIELDRAILKYASQFDFVLVDCLTLWLTNLLLQENVSIEERIKKFLHAIETVKSVLVLVSNEVGMGVVPDSKLGRQFQDLQGALNQKAARLADEVIFMVSGFPLFIKKQEFSYERV